MLMTVLLLFLALSLWGREATGATLTFPLRVALQTCVITDSGSSSKAFRVSWAFPTTSAILSTPAAATFQQDPYWRDNWYTVFETTMTVDDALFLSPIASQITITAETWQGVCIEKLTVNGVFVSGSLPRFLDSPCHPIHEGYPCSASFVGTFQLTPPLYPVTMRYTTCDVLFPSSGKHFLLELPQQNLAFTLFEVPARAETHSIILYLPTYLQTQTMKITAQQDNGWCLAAVTVENRPTTFTGTWINEPCGNGGGGYGCKNPVTFTFTLGSPTATPTRKPSRMPTAIPTTALPSAKPTFAPTAPTATPTSAKPTYTVTQNPTAIPTTGSPSVLPSTAPTYLPDHIVARIVSSPTYRVKMGTGFAAIDPVTGAVATWGKLARHSVVEEDAPMQVGIVAPSGGVQITAGRSAFAVRLADSSIMSWGSSSVLDGNAMMFGGVPLRTLIANDGAFAGITTAGAVFAFGSEFSGGNVVDNTKCNGFAAQLSSGIATIVSSAAAFAAITDTGEVYAWGSKYTGGGVSTLTRPELQDVISVIATRTAFVALTSSRSLVTWGDKMGGGDSSAVAHLLTADVMHVIGSQSVFVAFKFDGSLVVWGNALHGGDITTVAPLLAGGVSYVTFNAEAVVALKTDGSLVAWGVPGSGGDTSTVIGLGNVLNIYSTKYAFAALTYGGGVVAWGEANEGGSIPSALAQTLSSGVVSVFASDRAFAALKSDGAVVAWGNPHFGGNMSAVSSYLTSGVTGLCANDVAFTAMKIDGSAVVWGHPSSVPLAGILISAMDFSGVLCNYD